MMVTISRCQLLNAKNSQKIISSLMLTTTCSTVRWFVTWCSGKSRVVEPEGTWLKSCLYPFLGKVFNIYEPQYLHLENKYICICHRVLVNVRKLKTYIMHFITTEAEEQDNKNKILI